jgi:DnaJ-class molecular chaperone
MNTPFEILEISENTNNQQIKKAYLKMVKKFPPEQYPEEFKKIRKAFEKIKSKKDRLCFELFDQTEPTPLEITTLVLENSISKRPSENQFCQQLSKSLSKFKL